MARLAAMGVDVLIFDLFAGYAVPPFSAAVRNLHRQWGNPRNVTALRRAEDVAAAARLGVCVHFENLPEAMYRKNRDGSGLYDEDGSMFDLRHPADQWLSQYLTTRVCHLFPSDYGCFYVPLGIGNHVDHLVAFEVGLGLNEAGYEVYFHEDFPYALNKQEYHKRLSQLDKYASKIIGLDRASFDLRIEAVSYSRSQIPMLFGSYDGVPPKSCTT
jgi:hypothetical protein